MVKKSGLGHELYVHGSDLSGDTGSINNAGSPRGTLEVTAINKSAIERVMGLSDGVIDWSTWFNPAALQAHPVLSALPTTDVILVWGFGNTLADVCAMLVAKQINYDPSRGADGGLAFGVVAQAKDGVPLEWGTLLTAGKDTIASAGAQASRNDGTQAAAVTITSSSVANPTNILCAAVHGLTTGDTVDIAGHSGSTPAIDGQHTVTVIDTLNYTIPVNVTVGGTGGTSTLTSTRDGLAAVLETVDIASGTPTVVIEDSQDDSTFVTLLTFAAVADGAEPTAERVTVSGIVDRFLRLNPTGTFTNLDLVVGTRRGEGVDDQTYT